jgi:Kdo2-lipid IVA lauroyltransferase/acyltransferase
MYYLVYGLLYLLSLLPMRVLYIIADSAYLLLYYVIRYRKNIVMANLAIAFPEKKMEERIIIAKDFYKNFVDNFIEAIKLVSASKSFLTRHFIIDNPELIERYYKQGRKCHLHLGHNFNWEMANMVMPYYTGYNFLVVYMPIDNKIINRLFLKIRSRTGTKLLPATQLSRSIIQYRNTQYMLTLVADQAPGKLSGSYWLNFFNRPAPFMQGPEKGARIADIPVLFANIYKTKRGYYRAVLETACDNPAQLSEGELTRSYVQFLEKTIRKHPSFWLWTHRRWKHSWKQENIKLWIDKKKPPQG